MTGSRLDRAHLAHDLDALFPDGASVTTVPWPATHPRLDPVERQLLQDLLLSPPRAHQFEDLDPRDVTATQPGITRAGVSYYMEDHYRRSGRTYAGPLDIGNKFPVVRKRSGQLILLGGHHRTAAALLLGRAVRARVVGPVEPESSDCVVVTPSLMAGGYAPSFVHVACADRWTAEVFVNMRETAWLPEYSHHAISHLLRELGVGESWLQHQMHFAATGRIRVPTAWTEDDAHYEH